tara:strand:- start:1357 stop:2169 length:813 start_codon:yes stop_codon:yes gene_type:complete
MKILFNNSDLNEALYGVTNLGFVPTMGTLHNGHISLIKKSLKACDKTIVSIFINPTQFNNNTDYKNYPRNINNDLRICKKLKVDFVFLPNKKNIYSFKRGRKIVINKVDRILCAKYRKGHFEGVIDVMDRFLKIIKPNKVFMGKKDFQQLYFIKKYLIKKYKFKLVACKTIRDKNKLALSSRNYLLNKNDLIKARNITNDIFLLKRGLFNKKNVKRFLQSKISQLNKLYAINVEYLELRNILNFKHSNQKKNSKLFIAYYLNNIRLIDNF